MAVKKVVAKKKPVVKKRATTKKQEEYVPKAPPPICWFKLSTGEELVAFCDTTSVPEILVAYRPSVMMYYNEQLIFSPYGLQALNKDMFMFPESHVVSFYEVNDDFAVLYQLSRSANTDMAQAVFDQIVYAASKGYAMKIKALAEMPEPTDEELAAVAAQVDNYTKPEGFKIVTSMEGVPRSKGQMIDDLVTLAEKAGKGKNVK